MNREEERKPEEELAAELRVAQREVTEEGERVRIVVATGLPCLFTTLIPSLTFTGECRIICLAGAMCSLKIEGLGHEWESARALVGGGQHGMHRRVT